MLDLDEVIELAAAHECRLGAECVEQAGWWRGRCRRRRWEVELDPGFAAIGGQEPALGVKARLLVRF